MEIIGISGRKQSGKTTLANFLADKLADKYTVIEINFADRIYEMVNSLFVPAGWCWEPDEIRDHKDEILPTTGKTVRETLQWFGTDVCRNVYLDCWVNVVKKTIRGWRDFYGETDKSAELFFIIGDVRFRNELNFIQNEAGHVIRLTRCPFPEDNHESETALGDNLRDYDIVIDNTKTTIERINNFVWEFITKQKWV